MTQAQGDNQPLHVHFTLQVRSKSEHECNCHHKQLCRYQDPFLFMLNMIDARVLTFCTKCYNNVSRNKYPLPAQQRRRILLKMFATGSWQNNSRQQIFNLRYHHLRGEGGKVFVGIHKYSFVITQTLLMAQ